MAITSIEGRISKREGIKIITTEDAIEHLKKIKEECLKIDYSKYIRIKDVADILGVSNNSNLKRVFILHGYDVFQFKDFKNFGKISNFVKIEDAEKIIKAGGGKKIN
jgi:hypothetical protein